MDVRINIDLSDPEESERGTELMRYLVGVNLTQPYPSDPLSMHDFAENVLAPAYAELGGRDIDIGDKISLMAHTIQAAVYEITMMLMSSAVALVATDDPEFTERFRSEDDAEREEAIRKVLAKRTELWRNRQLDLGRDAED